MVSTVEHFYVRAPVRGFGGVVKEASATVRRVENGLDGALSSSTSSSLLDVL